MPIRCYRKLRASLASAARLMGVLYLLGLSHSCLASPIMFSSGFPVSAVAALVPDSSILSGGVSGFASAPQALVLQTSDLLLGNGSAAVPKPYFFEHTIAPSLAPEMLGGLVLSQDASLPAAPGLPAALGQTGTPALKDSLTIFAGRPSGFGGKLFTLDPATLTNAAYEDPTPVRVELTATDAERLRMLLVGVGVFAALMLAAAGHRSSGSVDANIPPVPIRKPIMGKAWVQRGATFRAPAKDEARSSQPPASSPESTRAERGSAAGPRPSTA